MRVRKQSLEIIKEISLASLEKEQIGVIPSGFFVKDIVATIKTPSKKGLKIDVGTQTKEDEFICSLDCSIESITKKELFTFFDAPKTIFVKNKEGTSEKGTMILNISLVCPSEEEIEIKY